AWMFVVWGAYHGALLCVHRAIPWPAWSGRPALRPLAVVATFLLVCIGWVFFRAASLADAGTILARLAIPSPGLALAPAVNAAVAALLGSVFVAHLLGTFADVPRLARAVPAPLLGAALAGGVLAASLLAPDTGGAFIYFQF